MATQGILTAIDFVFAFIRVHSPLNVFAFSAVAYCLLPLAFSAVPCSLLPVPFLGCAHDRHEVEPLCGRERSGSPQAKSRTK